MIKDTISDFIRGQHNLLKLDAAFGDHEAMLTDSWGLHLVYELRTLGKQPIPRPIKPGNQN